MRLELDDYVCTAIRLMGFGETTSTFDEPDIGIDAPPYEIFVKHLFGCMKDHDQDWHDDLADDDDDITFGNNHAKYFPCLGVCYAFVTSGQKGTIENLTKFGFNKSGPFTKLKHSDSEIYCFSMGCDDMAKKVGYVSKYDPRTPTERGY